MIYSSTMVGCRRQGLYRSVQEQSKWNNSRPCRPLEPGRNSPSLAAGKLAQVLHKKGPYKPGPEQRNSFDNSHQD